MHATWHRNPTRRSFHKFHWSHASHGRDGRAHSSLGQRIRITDSTGTKWYVWDGLDILLEHDGAGTLIRRYTHGHTAIPGVGSLIAVEDAEGNVYFYHMDPLGGIHRLTDIAQAIAKLYEFEPFGRMLQETGSAPNEFVFPGTYVRLHDLPGTPVSATRFYDVASGRATTRSGELPSTSYRVLLGNPMRIVDPSGRQGATLWGAYGPGASSGGFPSHRGESGLQVLVDSVPSRGVRGGSFGLGIEMHSAGALRLEYDRLVREARSLGLTRAEADGLRDSIKAHIRDRQNTLARSVTRKVLAHRRAIGHRPSRNSPFKPNALLTAKGKVLCRAGRGMVLLSLTIDVIDIATSPAEQREAEVLRAGGRLAGAWAGAKVGGLLCAWGGPWGVGICAFVGGVAGAIAGEELVSSLLGGDGHPPERPEPGDMHVLFFDDHTEFWEGGVCVESIPTTGRERR